MMRKLAAASAAAAILLASGLAIAAAETTGVIKDWNEQEKMLTLDNGDKFFIRGNVPMAGVTLTPGTRVTLYYEVDPGEQNEKIIQQILPATAGAPQN